MRNDENLHISTDGNITQYTDADHLWYEPTPYSVLDRIAQTGIITRKSRLVDFGSGKGRAAFLLHDKSGCSVVGVERIQEILDYARRNLETYIHRNSPIRFIQGEAEKYMITDEDVFFLFNPFSQRIYDMVFRNIAESCQKNPREMYVVLYYVLPPVEALAIRHGMELVEEILCDWLDNPGRYRKIQIWRVHASEQNPDRCVIAENQR